MKLTHIFYATCLLLAIAISSSGIASADNYHHNYSLSGPAISVAAGDSDGVAAALAAAQCHFSYGSTNLQWCASAGFAKEKDAINFGLAQRFDNSLISGTVSIEDNDKYIGVGIGGIF